MQQSVRPRRSVLYMPGANTRALEKARSLGADSYILDLEDAVAPDAKEEARANIAAALSEGGYGHREMVVRVNALASGWGHGDLAMVAASPAAGLLLPKVESADVIRQVEAALEDMGASPDLQIWAMMETPRGMLHAEEIAGASPRLTCFVMGTSDLAKDLHAAHTKLRLPMVTSLGLCMLAARSYGLSILDGVHLDLADDEGFAAACQQGLELGFDGKTLIHPKTIAKANEVFAPSASEVEWSKKIIAAHAAAEAEGQGVVVCDGKLVENLHVENAKRLVAMAEAIALREDAA